MSEHRRQDPTSGRQAASAEEIWGIAMHPAFRLGVIDAAVGRPLDHDRIVHRMQAETPRNALIQLGFAGDLFSRNEVELAQYRYEEGRLVQLDNNLLFRGYADPRFPPASLRCFLNDVAAERAAIAP